MRYDLVIDEMTWSYSRITSFEDCPYKWFMTYIYQDIKRKSPFFAEYGTYMHLILQMYLSGVLQRKDLSTFYVMHFRDNVRAKAPSQKIHQNYFNQGFQYLETLHFPKRKIIGVEEEVHFNFAGKPFMGYIDVISDDGTLIITDHKSRTLKPRSGRKEPTKLDAELENYFRQLYVYAAAVKETYGKYPDYLEFNCFRSQNIISEPFSIQRFHQVEDWAGSQINQIIRNDDWSAKPDYWRCNYLCDVCSECEYKQCMGTRR